MAHRILPLLLLASSLDVVRAESCPSTAGIVIGSILGTLVVLGVALLIWYLVKRHRNKRDNDSQKKSRGDNVEDHTYDNPTFQGEEESLGKPSPVKIKEEANRVKRVSSSHGRDDVDGSFTMQANQSNLVENGSHIFKSMSPRGGFGGSLQKTGSRGSLDNSYPMTEAEIITLAMQSQDIIGLGFNICGSMSEGIFVSQVHNRGPASECGRIKAGDRLLSITISFENMVYEDALTILSYASPYPVELQIQKVARLSPQKIPEVEAGPDKVSHPLYRSQSMDDVNKINKDSYITPRRTYSEMKKSAPVMSGSADAIATLEEDGGGALKKWDAKDDILREEFLAKTPSFTSQDLNLDPADMMLQASASKGGKRKSSTSSASSDEARKESVVNINASPADHNLFNVSSATNSSVVTVVEVPYDVDRLQEVSENGERDVAQVHMEQETNRAMVYKKKRRGSGGSSSSSSSTSSNKEEAITEYKIEATRVDRHNSSYTGRTDISLTDIPHNESLGSNDSMLNDTGLRLDVSRALHTDPSSDSLNVNYDETEFGNHNDSAIEVEEDMVEKTAVDRRRKEVHKEFFGETPSLLDRFSLELPAEVSDKKDGTPRSRSSSTSRSSSPERATESDISPVIQKKSEGGLAFDISSANMKGKPAEDESDDDSGQPKGGIAYYVSIDDQFNASPAQPVYTMDDHDPKGQQPFLVRSYGNYKFPRDASGVSHREREEQRRSEQEMFLQLCEKEMKQAEDNNNQPAVNQKTSKTLQLNDGQEINGDESPNKLTIVSHEEIRGAYKVAVNADLSSQVDDSEA